MKTAPVSASGTASGRPCCTAPTRPPMATVKAAGRPPRMAIIGHQPAARRGDALGSVPRNLHSALCWRRATKRAAPPAVDRRGGSSRPGVSPEAPVDALRIPNCELAGAVVLVVQLAYDPGPRIPRPVVEGIRVFRDDVDGAGAGRQLGDDRVFARASKHHAATGGPAELGVGDRRLVGSRVADSLLEAEGLHQEADGGRRVAVAERRPDGRRTFGGLVHADKPGTAASVSSWTNESSSVLNQR